MWISSCDYFGFFIKIFLLVNFFMINKLQMSFIWIVSKTLKKVYIQLRCNNYVFFFPGNGQLTLGNNNNIFLYYSTVFYYIYSLFVSILSSVFFSFLFVFFWFRFCSQSPFSPLFRYFIFLLRYTLLFSFLIIIFVFIFINYKLCYSYIS